MRRALIAAAAAAALCVPLSVTGSAAADSTVKVSGLSFPASTNTYLTYFGCQDLYHADTRAPQVRIDLGGAPAGNRSFALLMPGSETAAGPVHEVSSVAGTTVAGMYARSHEGGRGIAYVWYVTSKIGPGQVWAGRADLSAGSGWRYVNTAAASYDWQLLDAATGEEIRDGGTSTIGDFTDANGDGPGYMLAGFGCDGDFSVDALRYGSPGHVTTYDLEGITTTATMDPKGSIEVEPGEAVKLTGSTIDAGKQLVGAAMVLQAKPAGAASFRDVGGPVLPSNDGLVHKVVKPKVTTTYRWYVPEEGYASSSQSPTIRVVVIAAEPEESQTDPPGDSAGDSSGTNDGDEGEDLEVPPLPTQSPSGSPSESPSEAPDGGSGESPTTEPDQPTESPSADPTEPAAGESTDATP